jgi:hypothetical protein
VGKEKIIGALIFIIGLLAILYYTWGLIILQIFPDLADWVNENLGILAPLFAPDWKVLVILPIWLGVVLIMVIAMWIGWTMLTTPAPEPLEDFDFSEEELETPEEETPPPETGTTPAEGTE